MQLRKATRQQVKLKVALSGPSGSGKTYSALLLAYGLTGDWSKIAVIDTENRSSELYAHLGEFNALTLEPPYSPERYIKAIEVCEAEESIEVIILDSMTHEWDGKGGILEIKDSMSGNSFTNWGKLTPRHNAFVDKMLHSPKHVLATLRAKSDYVLVDKGGKQVPEKVGLKAITREGVEYEFTLFFDLDIKHKATASKDRTGLFMDAPEFTITPDTGKALKEWADSGVQVKDYKTLLLEQIEACTDTACTKDLYKQYPTLQQEEWFKSAIIAKGTALKEAEIKPANERKEEPAPTHAKEENAPPVRINEATAGDLKQRLILLLEHPLILRQEKTKALLGIHKLSKEELQEKIDLFEQTVANRENEPTEQKVYRNMEETV